MIRIFVLAFAAVAVALGLAVAYVFVQEVDVRTANRQMEARRARPAVVSKAKPPRPELPPLPPAISDKEVAEIRWAAAPKHPSGSKDDYTWAQIEKILTALQSERATRPQATSDLDAWYGHLASPEFTNSPDMPRHLAELEIWRQEMPTSPKPLVVMGQAHITHAWQARGSGYADTVTPEGAKLFDERLTAAQGVLQQAADLEPRDGEVFDLLISVAKGRGLPKPVIRGLLAQGMQADPTYMPIYTSIAHCLLPRWHGEPGEVERLANGIARDLPGDDGLDAFGQIAFQVNQSEPHTLFDGEYDRGLLAKAADVLVRRYAQDPNRVAFGVLCAYAAQDHAACRRAEAFTSDAEVTRVPNWSYYERQIQQYCAARKAPTDETRFIWGGYSPSGNIAFDGDPRFIWSGNGWSEQMVKMLDVQTGRAELVLEGPRASVNDLTFDRARQRLACIVVTGANDWGWCLWNAKSPDEPLITKTKEPMQAVALDPAGTQLALGFNRRVELFDLLTRKVTATIDPGSGQGYPRSVHFLRYSPDGTLLAVNDLVYHAADGRLVYDLAETLRAEKGKLPKLLAQHVAGFDHDNHALVTAELVKPNDKRPLVRFADDGKSWTTVIEDLGEHLLPLVLSPDGRMLATGGPYYPREPQEIVVWSLETGKKIKQFGGHWDHVSHLAFSADGKTLASKAGTSGPIKFWSLDRGEADQNVTSHEEKTN